MRLAACLFCSVLLMCFCGCRGSRRSYDRFIPPEEEARQAVETALTAWKDGQPPGRIATTEPAIQVVDSLRRPGQKLRDFKILGEAPAESPRCFAVRLVLENPALEQTVRYIVVGVDPLWVMRHEDYEMTAHWDMNMAPK